MNIHLEHSAVLKADVALSANLINVKNVMNIYIKKGTRLSASPLLFYLSIYLLATSE